LSSESFSAEFAKIDRSNMKNLAMAWQKKLKIYNFKSKLKAGDIS
jgi:hypothetical protein